VVAAVGCGCPERGSRTRSVAAPGDKQWRMPDGPYAGDVTPAEAWEFLQSRPDSLLVDVRSGIELALLGAPDLGALGKEALRVEWQTARGINPAFRDELLAGLRARGTEPGTPLLFICRTGGRSRVGAIEATALGFTAAYNVAHGFEGDLDARGHRNVVNGWRAAGLPWVQT
jgi:rhodanese-related sulfurtransferase